MYVCVYMLMSVALSWLKLHDRRRGGGRKYDRSSRVVSLCKERETLSEGERGMGNAEPWRALSHRSTQ